MSSHNFTINRRLSAPTQINLEITAACNHKCRYCYNYWRDDPGKDIYAKKLSLKEIDIIIDKLIAARVLNVIVSGGEPFINFPVMKHAIQRLSKAGIMTTCNSNLTLANREQLKELKEAGLPHILTSLSSYNPKTNDFVFGSKGAFDRVCTSIKWAVELGIKISINNIINCFNYKDVYKTGLLVHELGASNYFVTRGGVNKTENPEAGEVVILKPEEYIEVLDAAIRVRDETGINIYSLYQYPLCMVKDIEKYTDFVGRGCPAGKKLIAINVDGNIHACNHEIDPYGNIFSDDLIEAWNKMEKWRNGSLLPEDCKICKWLDLCEGGCRMSADAITDYDYLYQGSHLVQNLPDPIETYLQYLPTITPAALFSVNPDLRFRQEDGFYLVHILGGWVKTIENDTGSFLQKSIDLNKEFAFDDFPGNENELAILLEKQIVAVSKAAVM